MINPATTFGKIMLVFFWGGLSANIIIFTYLALRASGKAIDPLYLPHSVMVVNMILLGLKNYFDPKVKNI